MGIVVLSGVRTPEANATDLWSAVAGYQNNAIKAAQEFYRLANEASAPEDKMKLSSLANAALKNTFGVDEFGNINFGIGGSKDSATLKRMEDLKKSQLEFRRATELELLKDPDAREKFNKKYEELRKTPEVQKYISNKLNEYKKMGYEDDRATEMANRDYYNIMLDHWGLNMRPSFEKTRIPYIYDPSLGAQPLLNDKYNQILKGSAYGI